MLAMVKGTPAVVLRLQTEPPITPAEEKASALSMVQCPRSAVSVALCAALRR